MRVYVFGDGDNPEDRRAVEVARRLEGALEGVEFVFVGPNEDVPFAGEGRVVILDTVHGIEDVTRIEDVEAFVPAPRASVHDFDLGFQLRYLAKIGKLGKVVIVGVPPQGRLEGRLDHRRVTSILRKLVAQDMQGS